MLTSISTKNAKLDLKLERKCQVISEILYNDGNFSKFRNLLIGAQMSRENGQSIEELK
jgi:hypothetical protein